MQISDLIVEVRDVNRVRVGQITPRHLDLRAELRDCGVGSWTLRLPIEHDAAAPLQEPGAGIIVTGPDGVLFSGPVSTPSVAADLTDPAGILTVEGVTDDILLWNRLVYPDPANAPEAQSTAYAVFGPAPAEDVMRAIVDQNGGWQSRAGRHCGISAGMSEGRGPRVQRSLRFDVVGDAVADIATIADLRFRVVQADSRIPPLSFEIYPVADRRAEVRFDLRNGTLSSQTVSSAPATATRVIVAGQGQGEDRTLLERTNAEAEASETAWGVWGRVEVFKDQRNTDDREELLSEADKVLTEGAAAVQASVVPSDDLSMRFLHDWWLGDLVTVVVRGEERAARISAVSLILGPDGARVGASFGDLSGVSPVKAVERRTEAVERRVGALERNAEGGAAVTLGAAPLAAGTYLSDVTLPGVYSVDTSAVSSTIPDLPANLAGILEVRVTNDGRTITQRYTTYLGPAFERVRHRNPGQTSPYSVWTHASGPMDAADAAGRALVVSRMHWDQVSGFSVRDRSGYGAVNILETTDGCLWRRGGEYIADWRPVTQFYNGWQNYGEFHAPAWYTKTGAGIVVLSGLIKNGSASTTAFVLPEGYRPASRMMFYGQSTNNAIARIDVLPDGSVHIATRPGGWVSLAQVMFPAADVAPYEAWSSPTFASGWRSYAESDTAEWPRFGYWQDPLGRLWWRGMVRTLDGSGVSTDVLAFSLPDGLGPTRQTHGLGVGGNNGYANIDLRRNSGYVKIGTARCDYVSFCGFPTVSHNARPYDTWRHTRVNSGWVLYNTTGQFPEPSLTVFEDGLVFVDGFIRGGSGDFPMMYLPEGAQPGWADDGPGGLNAFAISCNNSVGRVDVARQHSSSAEYPMHSLRYLSGDTTWFSLASIRYHVGGWSRL